MHHWLSTSKQPDQVCQWDEFVAQRLKGPRTEPLVLLYPSSRVPLSIVDLWYPPSPFYVFSMQVYTTLVQYLLEPVQPTNCSSRTLLCCHLLAAQLYLLWRAACLPHHKVVQIPPKAYQVLSKHTTANAIWELCQKFRSNTPKPPRSLGKIAFFQFTKQCPPLTTSEPHQRDALLSLSIFFQCPLLQSKDGHKIDWHCREYRLYKCPHMNFNI